MSKPNKVEEMFNFYKKYYHKYPTVNSSISLLGNKDLLVEPMTKMGVVHKGEALLSLEECKKLRELRQDRIKNKK